MPSNNRDISLDVTDFIPDEPYRHLHVTYGWDGGPWTAVTYSRIDNWRMRSWSTALVCNPLPGVAFNHTDAGVEGSAPPDYSYPPDDDDR